MIQNSSVWRGSHDPSNFSQAVLLSLKPGCFKVSVAKGLCSCGCPNNRLVAGQQQAHRMPYFSCYWSRDQREFSLSCPVMKKRVGLSGQLLNKGVAMTNMAKIWLIAPFRGWTGLVRNPCTECPAFLTSGPRMLSQLVATAGRQQNVLFSPWALALRSNEQWRPPRAEVLQGRVRGLCPPSLLYLS